MKMHFDAEKYLPAGWDWENLKFGLVMGYVSSPLTLLFYLGRYWEARQGLYVTVEREGKRFLELVPTRTIAPFSWLISGAPLVGFWAFLGLMALQVLRHYRYHTQGAMSIYLMKRLPDRWELHRRCWVIPLLSTLVELALMGVMVFLCWLLYRYATPEVCLP